MEVYLLNLIVKFMLYGVGIIFFCLIGIFILNLFESPEARRERKIQEANIDYELAIQRRKELLTYHSVPLSPPTSLLTRIFPRK